MNFGGRIATITGGSADIGCAIALAFARQDARAFEEDVNDEEREAIEMDKTGSGDYPFARTDMTPRALTA